MTAPVFDINEVIAEAAAAALPAPQEDATPTPTPEATDLEETPSDESDPDAAPDAAPEDAPADAPTDAPTDEPPTLPEGYVAVPTLAEGMATDFALFDESGEVEVPALMVEYKANGKVRKDRLDQVVKLAQWGVYNEERDKKAQTIEQEYQRTVEAAKQMEQVVAEREAQMERLLNDDNFLEAVREAYLAENSPEKRAERAEQQVSALRVQQQMQEINRTGAQFYTGEIEPAVRMLTSALPNVSAEEIESRLEMVTHAHAEIAPDGSKYVPPSRYEAIRQYIVEDLLLWAQTVNAKRSQPAVAQKTAMSAELEKARIEAQKAKNLVGKATKPVGSVGKPSAPKVHAPSTVDDAVDSALKAALASFSS